MAAAAARQRRLPIVLVGAAGGFTLGVVARAWMRLISEDPGFTWGGTFFIVMGFTIFGLTQSIVAAARRRGTRRSRLTVLRVIGVAGMLPLFVAAGSVMFPTVIGGGLALARDEWRTVTRGICLVTATLPVLFVGNDLVGSFGWSWHTLAGFLGLLAIYATIIGATRFTFTRQDDGWRSPRNKTIVIAVVVFLLLLIPLAAGGIK
jgi:hypothetical protein